MAHGGDELARLREELMREAAYFREVQRVEVEILKGAAEGYPLPDGQFRTMQAAQKVRLAFAEYQQALKRYHDYIKEQTARKEDPADV